jgi:hypothetical protein
MAKTTKSQGPQDVSGWVGWVYFAGFLMLLSATFQMIAGLAGLFKDEVYVVGENNLLALDYTQWGWVHLLIGIVMLISAISLFNGNLWGRIVGVTLASLSAIANFAFISAYPLWSIVVIVVDIFIIYALLVHGDELKED